MTVGDLYWVELPSEEATPRRVAVPLSFFRRSRPYQLRCLFLLLRRWMLCGFRARFWWNPTKRTDCAALRSLLSFNSLLWIACSSQTDWAAYPSKSSKKSLSRLTT